MPRYPHTFSLHETHNHYGPSRTDPEGQEPIWTTRPPSGFYEESHPASNLWMAGAVTGSIFAVGFIPTGGGRRVFDYYISALRGIEEYSPGGILRTFQTSTFFSQFGSPVAKGFEVSGEFLCSKAGQGYARYLSTLAGDAPGMHVRMLTEGVSLRGGSLFYGKGTDVALRYASAMISPASEVVAKESEALLGSIAGKHLGSGYARSMGLTTGSRTGFSAGDARLFGEVIDTEAGPLHRQIIGAQTRLGYVGRQLGGIGTEFVSRFNRLLEAPFEMQPFRTVFSGIQRTLRKTLGTQVNLAVPYASGTKMLGSLAWKYGALAGAVGLGYKTIDYGIREASIFDNTALDQGLTAGIATGWTRASVLASSAAELLGGHAYREAQEAVAPGSTDLSRLLAFPIMGGLGAASLGYGIQVGKMARLQVESAQAAGKGILGGLDAAAARVTIKAEIGKWGTEGLMGKLGKFFGDKAYPFIGKVGPTKLAGLVGAGIGTALIAPFIPGALVPSTRPEELERIYSGQQEVPIRKGRFWEFSRVPWEGKRIDRYRPHWFPRMLQRSKEAAIWGDDVPNPITQWFKKEFTYDLEKKFYHERPFLISSLPFEDIPFVGPILANTIGRIIKPPVYMHESEWRQPSGEQLAMAPGFGEIRAPELGELPPPVAETPYNVTGILGEQVYRMCFTSNTKIKLSDFEEKNIQDIQPGDIVWGHETDQKVLHIFKRKRELKDNVKELSLFGDYSKLHVTDGHVVYALKTNYCSAKGYNCIPHGSHTGQHCQRCKKQFYRQYQPDWYQISELSQGDFLIQVLPKLGKKKSIYLPDILDMFQYGIEDNRIYRRVVKQFQRKACKFLNHKGTLVERPANFYQADYLDKSVGSLPLTIDLTWDFGWLCGYTLAEGSARKYQVSYGANISEVNTHFKKLTEVLTEIFSVSKVPWHHQKNRDGITNGVEAVISSVSYADLMSILVGKPRNNQIHSILLDGNENFIIGLINGFIDGDFYIREKECVCNQSSSVLQNQLVEILHRLGINTSKTKSFPSIKKEGKIIRYVSYGISFFRTGIQHLRRCGASGFKLSKDIAIGPINTTSNFIKQDKHYVYVYKKIKSYKDYDQPVDFLYDLEIENTHVYYAENCLVHNSEMMGLPGFTMTAIKENLTGSADLFDQTMRLESARRAFGIERSYWDLELGGVLGASEGLRRLYPHIRRQIPQYNPIKNLSPDWLPGPGEKSPDFQVGDPYSRIPEGEMRLPGAGYVRRYPELKGIDPSEYPDIHKHKILGDIAPYSDKYKLMLQKIKTQRKYDSWSDYEESIYTQTLEQVEQKKIGRKFAEYKYLSPTGDIDDGGRFYKDESKGVLTALNEMKAAQQPESGVFTKLFGGYWELLAHNAETSLDILTPISPAAKLVHQRTAIEDYENSQVFGTESGFWSHPYRDFVRPFLTKLGASMGFRAIPEHIRERRELESYFDTLEYVKNTRLSNLAKMSGDTAAAKEFASKKNETMFGLNPFTYNLSNIFRSLPRRDRDYFDSFAKAETVEERTKILELVPENEKALYVARWKLQFKQDVEIARKADLLSEEQVAEADVALKQIDKEAKAEGFPTSDELFAEYVATRLPGENYGDWYRRTKLLNDVPLPADSWIGWNPSVDLEDIKLKLVQNIGEDAHNYDLWPNRAQALINKPYIDMDTIQGITEPEELSPSAMRDRVDTLLLTQGVNANVFHRTFPGVDVDIEQDVDFEPALQGLM